MLKEIYAKHLSFFYAWYTCLDYNLFRLKIGKIILSLPLIQKPIKIYPDKNCELVYHGFKIIYKRFKRS